MSDALVERLAAWRDNRDPGWHKDYGYRLQDVVQRHRYDYAAKGSKPDDPGWHVCSCGTWEGYWSGFDPHVADHLRAVVEQEIAAARAEHGERIAQAIEAHACNGSPESCADVLAGAPCPYDDAARIARTAAQTPATSTEEER